MAEATVPHRPEADQVRRGLGGRTWTELAERRRSLVLVLPLGSLEQHGPHLPLDTDTTVAQAIAERLADVEEDLVVAPALAYGASGEHADFAGTLSIGHVALADTVVELVRSARPAFDGVMVLSAHGGNAAALAAAERRACAEGDRLLIVQAKVRGGDAHAGRTETSLLLALAPESVRPFGGVRGRTEPLGDLSHQLRAEGVRAVSPNGVLGDPSGASAEEGWEILDALVDDARQALAHWRVTRRAR